MDLGVKVLPVKHQVAANDVPMPDYRDLYGSYRCTFMRVLVGRGLSHDDAEDVIHESFVKLLSLDASKLPNFLPPYLFKIASNLAIDLLRRRHRSPEKQSIETIEEAQCAQDILLSPEEIAQHTQMLECIAEALKELPDKCRCAFLFYKIKGYSYDEIANILNVSESMVRKYVLRAIRHCYIYLEDTI